jgi:hypothetical protein
MNSVNNFNKTGYFIRIIFNSHLLLQQVQNKLMAYLFIKIIDLTTSFQPKIFFRIQWEVSVSLIHVRIT